MTRFAILAPFLFLLAALPVAFAHSITAGPETARFARHHAIVCGSPVSPESWHLGHFSQRFQGCVIAGDVGIATPTLPPRTPLPSPSTTPGRTPQPTVETPAPSTPTPPPTPAPTLAPSLPQIILSWLNSVRANAGVAPLTFDSTLAQGTSSCVGAQGHAIDMAGTQSIWHVNSVYPAASFPNDVCGPFRTAGQNVGVGAGSTDEANARSTFDQMMAEPHDPATCASQDNHACNIINPAFTRVGIAVADGTYAGLPASYVVETFTG